VGLEQCPLSLVSTIEELLERKSIGSGLEIREYGRRDPPHLLHNTPYPQKLALTSPTISVGIAHGLKPQSYHYYCYSTQSKMLRVTCEAGVRLTVQ
jgi:hypothetical protein